MRENSFPLHLSKRDFGSTMAMAIISSDIGDKEMFTHHTDRNPLMLRCRNTAGGGRQDLARCFTRGGKNGTNVTRTDGHKTIILFQIYPIALNAMGMLTASSCPKRSI